MQPKVTPNVLVPAMNLLSYSSPHAPFTFKCGTYLYNFLWRVDGGKGEPNFKLSIPSDSDNLVILTISYPSFSIEDLHNFPEFHGALLPQVEKRDDIVWQFQLPQTLKWDKDGKFEKLWGTHLFGFMGTLKKIERNISL
jgi:hypothetical protein